MPSNELGSQVFVVHGRVLAEEASGEQDQVGSQQSRNSRQQYGVSGQLCQISASETGFHLTEDSANLTVPIVRAQTTVGDSARASQTRNTCMPLQQ